MIKIIFTASEHHNFFYFFYHISTRLAQYLSELNFALRATGSSPVHSNMGLGVSEMYVCKMYPRYRTINHCEQGLLKKYVSSPEQCTFIVNHIKLIVTNVELIIYLTKYIN